MSSQLRIYKNTYINPIDNYPTDRLFILEKNNEHIMALISPLFI